jgi:streptogramin lyase
MRSYLSASAVILAAFTACGGPSTSGGLPATNASRSAPAACPTSPPGGYKVARANIYISGQPTIGAPEKFHVGIAAYDAFGNFICGSYSKPFSLKLTDSQEPARVTLRGSKISSSFSRPVLWHDGRGDRFTLRATNGELRPIELTIATTIGAVTTFSGAGKATYDLPSPMVFDESGDLWTVLYEKNRSGIARISANGDVSAYYNSDTDGKTAYRGSIASSGSYRWVGYVNAKQQDHLARISSDGTFKDIALPALPPGPIAPIAGENGDVWFAIGLDIYVSDENGNVQLAGTIPTVSMGGSLFFVLDPRHRGMWYNLANEIGLLKRSGGVIDQHVFSEFGSCFSGSIPFAVGRDGNFWAPYPCERKALLRFDTDGNQTSYSKLAEPPSKSLYVSDVVSDRQGNLFVPEQYTGAVVRITPAGAVTEYSVAEMFDRTPQQVLSGPDGFMYVPIVGFTSSGSPTAGLERFDPTRW